MHSREKLFDGNVILGNVTIGEGAIVGAGSVVTKPIPAKQVWVGNPARFLRRNNSTTSLSHCILP